ncbi:putative 2-(5''-triphosphoribosyl)-3'-dephosphocoenzyme-A synthase [uncultured Alphaproteobacteria bacterium]|uniref:Probable 2-(5''-triphosphoribosyl)-3'-dephosphocoenzyme-A synthase n=1 Tax=uncultured Alphaproteobacteria bacterium TaxID=91750 RepID=A0A212K489_9PROT|nr:putative 2-(5''-triphosphoribosyl)-3'-dephosphocoenzyme-A synthase [uncultured Alphaproteobacteria bacterium]
MDFSPHLSTRTFAWDMETESTAWDIGSAVLSGLLLEVSAHPKPGLVTPRSMGAHRDMDHQTFLLSSAALAPGLYACARAGLAHPGAAPALLPELRAIGRACDGRLLEATHGVNTQRGALFCGGLVAAAAGRVARTGAPLAAEAVLAEAGRITEGMVARELAASDPAAARTAGEILFHRHGSTGVRGEAEAGFPTVRQHGLPALRAALDAGSDLNRALVHALVALVAEAEDSTVLWRGGPQALAFLKAEAAQVRGLGGALAEAGLAAIERLDTACVARNLSPGGAADLLAVTVAAYLLENRRFPVSSTPNSNPVASGRGPDSRRIN